MRIWVIGPIAWDSVLYLNQLPEVGGFTHAKSHQERPGGQALNIAVALEKSGFQTGLVGYVGNDQLGRQLSEFICENVDISQISIFIHPTPHVVVIVNEAGERTMIGMEKSYFGEIKVDCSQINPEDLVIWPIWRDGFSSDFQEIRQKGCRTIVGLAALKNKEISADIAIGSKWELIDDYELSNFNKVIITDNQNGATEISKNGKIDIPANAREIVDATGAGDAFICGIAKAMVENLDGKSALEIASKWSELAVSSRSSIPPAFS